MQAQTHRKVSDGDSGSDCHQIFQLSDENVFICIKLDLEHVMLRPTLPPDHKPLWGVGCVSHLCISHSARCPE